MASMLHLTWTMRPSFCLVILKCKLQNKRGHGHDNGADSPPPPPPRCALLCIKSLPLYTVSYLLENTQRKIVFMKRSQRFQLRL